MNNTVAPGAGRMPSPLLSLTPLGVLIASIVAIIAFKGSESVSDYGQYALLGGAAAGLLASYLSGTMRPRQVLDQYRRSTLNLLPTLVILACIAMVSTTWMLSGIVPTLICYGLGALNPDIFLFLTCAVCACVSVLLGSSWTTIATVGVAFAGIGTVLGYGEGWIAGAIISGAYFGDKVSPLSDTTVIASSTCGVDLFTHIRYLMITAVPTMTIALAVFLLAGLLNDNHTAAHSAEITDGLHGLFVISPWLLVIPAVTMGLCLLKVKSVYVLIASTLMGLSAIFAFQPHITAMLMADGSGMLAAAVRTLSVPTDIATGNSIIDTLASTSGVQGMVPTITLVVCAMVFGTSLIATGMLQSLAAVLTRRLNGPRAVVSATVGSGLMLNACTADQYISLIIGGNLYGKLYEKAGLEPRLLSRSLEDSISVTSPIVPWNSCGITQSTVLGVSTFTYLPYCVFNYLQPVMSIAMVHLGIKIRRRHHHPIAVEAEG